MKHLKYLPFVLGAVILAYLHISSSAQTVEERKLAAINGSGSSLRWDVVAPNAGVTLIVSAPDGRVFSKSF